MPLIGGIGAGNPDMQRASGSPNPTVDAQRALMDPEAHASEVELEAKADAETHDRRAALLSAIRGAEWSLPGSTAPLSEQISTVESADDSLVNYLFGEYDRHVKAQVDRETEALADGLGGMFRIGPEHPEYNVMRDVERRRRIEAKCAPLAFDQLIMRGYVDQVIETRPGFSLILRSLTAKQGLWIERMARDRLKDVSQMEAQHLFSLWQLAVSLQGYVVGGRRELISPDIYAFTKDSQYDDFVKTLDLRMDALGERPLELTQDMIAQYAWFCGRVRLLISGGDLADRLGKS